MTTEKQAAAPSAQQGNVLELSAEGVSQATQNGTPRVSVATPDLFEKLGKLADSPLLSVDKKILAGILWRNGFQQEALRLDKSDEKMSFLTSIGAKLDRNITFKHVAIGVVVGTVLYFVYEGLAVAFDLPSAELLFSKTPAMPGAPVGGAVAATKR